MARAHNLWVEWQYRFGYNIKSSHKPPVAPSSACGAILMGCVKLLYFSLNLVISRNKVMTYLISIFKKIARVRWGTYPSVPLRTPVYPSVPQRTLSRVPQRTLPYPSVPEDVLGKVENCKNSGCFSLYTVQYRDYGKGASHIMLLSWRQNIMLQEHSCIVFQILFHLSHN